MERMWAASKCAGSLLLSVVTTRNLPRGSTMYCISDSPPDSEASCLSCPPLRSTQTECNCGVKLMCLQCHLRLVGTVQSATFFPRVTFSVRPPPADRPSVTEVRWESYGRRPELCVATRRERSSWCELCVWDGPHTGLCVAGLWSACCLLALRRLEWPQSAAAAAAMSTSAICKEKCFVVYKCHRFIWLPNLIMLCLIS